MILGLPPFQWPFQEPKLEVPTIYKGYVRGYTPKIWPHMAQYLHFRILEFPLTFRKPLYILRSLPPRKRQPAMFLSHDPKSPGSLAHHGAQLSWQPCRGCEGFCTDLEARGLADGSQRRPPCLGTWRNEISGTVQKPWLMILWDYTLQYSIMDYHHP